MLELSAIFPENSQSWCLFQICFVKSQQLLFPAFSLPFSPPFQPPGVVVLPRVLPQFWKIFALAKGYFIIRRLTENGVNSVSSESQDRQPHTHSKLNFVLDSSAWRLVPRVLPLPPHCSPSWSNWMETAANCCSVAGQISLSACQACPPPPKTTTLKVQPLNYIC